MSTLIAAPVGTTAEIRPDLRALSRPERRQRPSNPPAADGVLLAVIGLSLGLNCWRAEWAELAAIAGCGLASALLLLTGPLQRRAWLTGALIGAPAAIGLAQCLTASTADYAATEGRILRWLAAALFCLSVGLIRDTRHRDRLADGLALLGGALAALGLTQLALPEPLAWWPFPNRNHFAACCELLLPLAAWRAWQGRSRPALAAAAALGLAGLLSGSRAGTLLVLAELLWLGWWLLRKAPRPPAARWLVAGLAALPLLAALLGGEAMWKRWSAGRPLLYRDQIWEASWDLVAQRPWTGHGLGSFAAVYPSVMRFDTGEVVHRAHNDWLEWVVEGGWPSIIPLLILFALVIPRLGTTPWAVGVPAVLMHSLVDYPLDRFSLLLLFCLVSTLAMRDISGSGSHRRARKKPLENPVSESEIFRGTALE